MPLHLMIYIYLILGYRLTEYIVMRRHKSERRGTLRDWTRWLLILPFGLTIIGPLAEVYYFGWQSSLLNWVFGALFIVAATWLRCRGHMDLRGSYSMAVERPQEGLITNGIYAHIRHPLYLGNLCLFIGCPLFLAARWTWIATLLGLIGMLIRIPVEERLLTEAFPEYAAYRERTKTLIPGVW